MFHIRFWIIRGSEEYRRFTFSLVHVFSVVHTLWSGTVAPLTLESRATDTAHCAEHAQAGIFHRHAYCILTCKDNENLRAIAGIAHKIASYNHLIRRFASVPPCFLDFMPSSSFSSSDRKPEIRRKRQSELCKTMPSHGLLYRVTATRLGKVPPMFSPKARM